MFKAHLRHGMVAGAAGGAASAGVLVGLGERFIAHAIRLEDAAAHAAGAPRAPEMFGRTTQVVGGVLGLVLVGVAVGVVFAVVFSATRHRLGGRDDWRRAVNLAAVAFLTVSLVPWLKYPANPPSVGDPTRSASAAPCTCWPSAGRSSRPGRRGACCATCGPGECPSTCAPRRRSPRTC